MNIDAIETHYAGCRFRSRLEARWAVFFDALDIKWQYEPQGFKVGRAKRPYLPDFHLPELSMWVEVKGDEERLDLELLADAVEGPCGPIMLILGPIPMLETGKIPAHSLLLPAFDVRPDRFDADVVNRFGEVLETQLDDDSRAAVQRMFDMQRTEPVVVLQPVTFIKTSKGASVFPTGLTLPVHRPLTKVLEPSTVWPILPIPAVRAAYMAARSARFEHGESPHGDAA